jgi:hypothetical protein
MRKGQTAIEVIFVVMLVIVAVGVIFGSLSMNQQDIETIYKVRLELQDLSLRLSMQGVETHLIRIDLVDYSERAKDANMGVWIVSKDCSLAEQEILDWDVNSYLSSEYHTNGILCEDLYGMHEPVADPAYT